ncbi:MAG: prepilin peptidase [Candidatus Roizmanbacteria bacterium]|nr:prepilin peptidase [Candidatus Roizmanbacteria bacterium]
MFIEPIFPIPYSIFLLFVVGLFFGSFLNVLADRLSMGKTMGGRSMCDSCKHVLSWNDLIPIVSFVILRGKCRYCKAPFSVQYPLVELFTGVIFVMTWYFSLHSVLIPSDSYLLHSIHLGFAAVLIVMLLADFRYQVIPDEMQIALLILGVSKILYTSIVIGGVGLSVVSQTMGMHALYGLSVMAPLLLVFLITKGRGMGFGDVKLAFVMGLILGLLPGFLALYIGFVIGGIVGGILLLTKKGKRKTKIAFGPFLILGLYLMMFFESEIVLFVSKIYGF